MFKDARIYVIQLVKNFLKFYFNFIINKLLALLKINRNIISFFK